MLDSKGFDLWADGYDKSVGVSDEENTYPFAGYKEVLGTIFQTVAKKPNAAICRSSTGLLAATSSPAAAGIRPPKLNA